MRAERYYRADEDLTANDAKFIRVKDDEARLESHGLNPQSIFAGNAARLFGSDN